jgi:hypothetical protein
MAAPLRKLLSRAVGGTGLPLRAAGLVGVVLLFCAAPVNAQPAADKTPTKADPDCPRDLFRVESEAAWRQRLQYASKEKLVFPAEPPLPAEGFVARHWPMMVEHAVPSYVCYCPLMFEQINMERYGWDLGIVSVLASPAIFFFDAAILPYNLGAAACRPYECSAGYCLPGDPVPLKLYPPEWSLSGALAEGAAIGLVLAIFP